MRAQATPVRLVDRTGRVRFGVFDSPFRELNLEDVELSRIGVLSRALARFRLKQWQHYALITPEVFVGLAVVDVGYLKLSWCSVVDRADNRHFEHHRQVPRADIRLARTLWNDGSHFRLSGYTVEIRNQLDEGRHDLSLHLEAAGDLPAVRGKLRCLHGESIQPLVVSLPVGPNRAMYSHKVPLPLEGELRVGERCYVARPQDSIAILDIHKAHYPRHTWWMWATGWGRDAAGRSLAFNLTRNVNRDDSLHNENALWLDGRIQPLGPARFYFDSRDLMRPWHLDSACGALELAFHPQGERQENVRLGLVRSVFHQPWGRFRGLVRFGDEEIEVDEAFGVCEHHDSVW